MRKIIINAYADLDGYSSSPQLRNSFSRETYLMNSYASLYSAKQSNLDIDCCLITNVDLSINWRKRFENARIRVIKIDFNIFRLSDDFKWALAFFKLCAIKYACDELNYDKYLLIDTDTIVNETLEDLFDEIENDSDIMLYDIGHILTHKDRQIIINNYENVNGIRANIRHFGGEFICGAKEGLKIFMSQCLSNFEIAMKSNKLDKTTGDEYIISATAYNFSGGNILSAEPYIYRYWTGSFYLVSTNWLYNGRAIWHFPNEKESGMIRMYFRYMKGNRSISRIEIAKIFGLPKNKLMIIKNNFVRRISRRYYKYFYFRVNKLDI